MRRLLVLILPLILGAVSIFPSAVGHAQEASDGETALARQLFREGIEASRAGNFAQARRAFERSYQVSPRPTTLLNLAGALAQTGSLVEAAEKYRLYLHITRDEGNPRRRQAAEQMLDALMLRMPHAVIEVPGLAASDVLQMDDRVLSHAVIGERLPVDPDHHTITLRRGDEVIATQEFAVEEAQQQDVLLDVRNVPRLAPTPREVANQGTNGQGGSGGSTGTGSENQRTGGETGGGTDSGGGLFASPIFWIITGAILVGGGVTALLFFTRAQTEDPFMGNIVPGRLVLD